MGVLVQIATDRRFTPSSRNVLGRHAPCTLLVDNPRISGIHASVNWNGTGWELQDHGSLNGTFVDGRRLDPGERRLLAEGNTFSLANVATFALEDASAPMPSARHTRTSQLRVASGGLLVLPDDERPEVSLFEDGAGQWVAESGDATRSVKDGAIVIVDGEEWKLDLPSSESVQTQKGGPILTLDTISLSFAVSPNEHVEITMVHDGERTPLPSRAHDYLLLTLARAWLEDEAASSTERGWLDVQELCRMLATEPRKLNVDVCRARKQLASAGVLDAAGIIARRPNMGQIRLGVDQLEVTKR